jgi:site-specific recombinase XerD
MLIDQHLAYLTFRNRTQATIRERRTVLVAFHRALSGRPLTEATKPDIMGWLSRPLAPESRRAYLSHLRGFYAWALDEELVAADPTMKVPSVRVPRSTPRPMDPGDLALALDQADTRMRAWLYLMAGAGLRCIEVAALEPRDVILDPAPMLHLRVTKGGGQATMPLHPTVLGALGVLPVRHGVWWSVTRHTVSTQVNAYLRNLGITSTAHSLRHSAACQWYEVSGHDLITTQRLLRHRSVASTQIYADVSPTRPAEVVAAVRLAG